MQPTASRSIVSMPGKDAVALLSQQGDLQRPPPTQADDILAGALLIDIGGSVGQDRRTAERVRCRCRHQSALKSGGSASLTDSRALTIGTVSAELARVTPITYSGLGNRWSAGLVDEHAQRHRPDDRPGRLAGGAVIRPRSAVDSRCSPT
jgi:hypothetical protein